jgi:nucleoside phosphorylase
MPPRGMTGNNSAATIAKDMMRSFDIKMGLMVGIGGGRSKGASKH